MSFENKPGQVTIPILFGIDAVHGHHYLQGATIFPQNLALAATWNPALVRRANEITALETRASDDVEFEREANAPKRRIRRVA